MFGLYLHQVYLQHQWILPSGMFYEPFKGKFSAVYFILCQVLVGFALLSFAFRQLPKITLWQLILGLALIFIGVLGFIAARALNGVLISGLGLICLIASMVYSIFSRHRSLVHRLKFFALGFIALSVLTSSLYAFWVYDQRYEGKLSNLIGDTQIAIQ